MSVIANNSTVPVIESILLLFIILSRNNMLLCTKTILDTCAGLYLYIILN